MDGRRGAYEGTHKGCPYGDLTGLVGRVWRSPFEWAPVANVDTRSMREVVGEGALRGRSPGTREGRIGPTARKSRGEGLGARG